MIRLEVRAGPDAGKVFELDRELATVGRTPSSDVLLTAPSVAERHARLLETSSGLLLEGNMGGLPTARIRAGERVVAHPGNLFRLTLRQGDLIELGSGEEATVIAVTAIEAHAADPHVVALRKLEELGPASTTLVRDPAPIARVIELQRQIGAASSIDDVLAIFADAALELVPTATHATLVLRDDANDDDAYVPVLTLCVAPKVARCPPMARCRSLEVFFVRWWPSVRPFWPPMLRKKWARATRSGVRRFAARLVFRSFVATRS
ncbi:MAG: FHA domain-containing protein [Polyangiaceae bacterium]